jgi:hypothetical protein
MSNLEKFNSTLESFDVEVQKLKTVSTVYQKLDGLIEIFDNTRNLFAKNSNELKSIVEIQRKQVENIKESIVEFQKSNKKNHDILVKLLEDKIEVLRKENKEFYRELEGTIKIKLDDNKAQIKQLIESERIRIKEIFEHEFHITTKELKSHIDNQFKDINEQLKQSQKSIRNTLLILGIITIVISLVILIKQFI